MIWFNPAYSLNVKTNTGKVKLVRKHFPGSHKFNKIFNLNTIKINYRSMPNVKNLIKQHNSKVVSNNQDKIQRSCNCRIKESCPPNRKCLHQCMVYKAEVTTYMEYYGTSEGQFKFRYNNCKQSFRHKSHINDTELSKYLCMLKANGIDYHLKWSINYMHSDTNMAQEGANCVLQKKRLLFQQTQKFC